MCANVASDACTVLALRSGPLLGHCDSLSLYSPRPSPLVRWQHQQQQNTPFGAVSPTLNQQSGSNLFGNSPANVCLRERICCLIQCLTEWVGGRSHTFVYLGMDIYMDEYMRIRNHVFSTQLCVFVCVTNITLHTTRFILNTMNIRTRTHTAAVPSTAGRQPVWIQWHATATASATATATATATAAHTDSLRSKRVGSHVTLCRLAAAFIRRP